MPANRGYRSFAWIAAILLLLLWELAARLVEREILVPRISRIAEEALAARLVEREILVPGISRIVEEAYRLLVSPETLTAIGITLGRIFFSFFLCLVATLVVGIPARWR